MVMKQIMKKSILTLSLLAPLFLSPSALAEGTMQAKQNAEQKVVSVKPTAMFRIENINQTTGTYDVVISNIQSANGVKQITVPTWTTKNGQDDLKWHIAIRQVDGSYKYTVKQSEHGYEAGEYVSHAYITDNIGKVYGYNVGKVVLNAPAKPVATFKITNVNQALGVYDVVISNIVAANGVKQVTVPTWTTNNGQDDLKWHVAVRQSDGSYKYTVKQSEHNYEAGEYISHAYIMDNTGKAYGYNVGRTKLSEARLSAKAYITNQTATSYDVEVRDVVAPNGLKDISVPTWTDKNGQDDLKWHLAVKQGDGRYKYTVQTSEHGFERGLYHSHVYVTDRKGEQHFIELSPVTFVEIKPSARVKIENINQNAGTYDVIISDIVSPNGIKQITVPTWTERNGQDDLKWHVATKQVDGTYKYTVNINQHQYEGDKYISHVYVTDNAGVSKAYSAGEVHLMLPKRQASVTITNKDNVAGKFDVVISNVVSPYPLEKIVVPIWSEMNGQDDLKWYEATKQPDGSYRVSVDAINHRDSKGDYNVHVYFSGKSSGLEFVNSAITAVDFSSESLRIVATPINKMNYRFDTTIRGQRLSRARQVSVAIWSDTNGQDDLKWYPAFKQADGSYSVTTRLANHNYQRGSYNIHVYAVIDSVNTFIGAKIVQVDLPSIRQNVQAELNRLKERFIQLFKNAGGQQSLYLTPHDSLENVLVGDHVQRSASTIKLFILASAYQKASRGELDINQHYTIKSSDIVSDSVSLSGSSGKTYPLSQIARFMVETSDNTATNIMIRHVGGVEAVNNEIRRMGYTQTYLERYMKDSAAINAGKENYISAREAANLIKDIYNKTAITPQYDSVMLQDLSNNYYPEWLTARIRFEAKVYDKPGQTRNLGVENDIAVIEKDGRAFIAAVLTQHGSGTMALMKQYGQDILRELISRP